MKSFKQIHPFFIFFTVVILYLGWNYNLYKNYYEGRTNYIRSTDPLAGNRADASTEIAQLAQNIELLRRIVSLSDSRVVFTSQKDGVYIAGDDLVGAKRIFKVDDIYSSEQAGLIGLAKDAKFELNKYLYIYYTYNSGDNSYNTVEKLLFNESKLNATVDKILITGIPSANFNNGGGVISLSDGNVYFATGTGDASKEVCDKESLAGKVLRVDSNGVIPETNPIKDNPYFASGFDNPVSLSKNNNDEIYILDQSNGSRVYKLIEGGEYGKCSQNSDNNALYETSDDLSDMKIENDFILLTNLTKKSIDKVSLDGKLIESKYQKVFGRLGAIADSQKYFFIGTRNNETKYDNLVDDDRIIRIIKEKL